MMRDRSYQRGLIRGPLQAADLTAWMRHADRRNANEFVWLREHMVGLTPLKPLVEFDKEMIDLLLDETPIPPDQQWKVTAAQQAVIETFIKVGARHYVPKPSIWGKVKKRKKTR